MRKAASTAERLSSQLAQQNQEIYSHFKKRVEEGTLHFLFFFLAPPLSGLRQIRIQFQSNRTKPNAVAILKCRAVSFSPTSRTTTVLALLWRKHQQQQQQRCCNVNEPRLNDSFMRRKREERNRRILMPCTFHHHHLVFWCNCRSDGRRAGKHSVCLPACFGSVGNSIESIRIEKRKGKERDAGWGGKQFKRQQCLEAQGTAS